IVVNDETLALDAIREVGPGGNFLKHRHTKQHMREIWVPRLFDRRPYEVWEERRDGARDWARARAKEILASHHPQPLDPALDAELGRIIAAVEG
ncbi:MAG: trimethylamine methyltransferase family protein, partial [Chloroflexia bacterium]